MTALRVLAVVTALAAAPSAAAAQLAGEIGLESRAFVYQPLLDDQSRHDASILLQPELYFDWTGAIRSSRSSPSRAWT